MADDDNEGIGIDLTKKYGPLTLWEWLMGAGAAAVVIYHLMKGKTGATGTSGGGTFTSTSTSSGSTPTGGQYSNSYTASGPSSGQLTYQAGPMPFQQGDVYVNYPSAPTSPTPTSTGVQATYPPGMTQGFYFTTPRDMYPQEAAQHAYNLQSYNGNPDYVSLAIDSGYILAANPQITMQNNGLIPAGTKLFIPGQPNTTGQASTWDNITPNDSQPYVPSPEVPIPQATMSTNTAGA